MHAPSGVYSALAVCVLLLHALFIVWVVFGAFADALASRSSLVAHRFLVLGNPYGTAALAVSSNLARELA